MLEITFSLEDIDPAEIGHIFASLKLKKKYYKQKDGSFLPLDGADMVIHFDPYSTAVFVESGVENSGHAGVYNTMKECEDGTVNLFCRIQAASWLGRIPRYVGSCFLLTVAKLMG